MQSNTSTRFRLAARTDAGKVREHNEDNYIVCPDLAKAEWYFNSEISELSDAGCLLVLADGMGGLNAGEVASALAVEAVKNYFSAHREHFFCLVDFRD